ncbi:hypothetical protein OIU84_020329 [Salix udensis]|uniref:B box-type domain-containing protein n=1 Tax=Salix udensis TaxID=889485 RepID=A0AAD6KS79_9ROSI|nr:hypothetical protein OIU84_020329 [Salix udensis]
MAVQACELCQREACLYCDSDAAFLCFECDSDVHNANFVVARHLRRVICSRLQFSHRKFRFPAQPHLFTVSPASPARRKTKNRTPSPALLPALVLYRLTGDRLKRSGNLRSEGVFLNWCKRLGLDGDLVVQRATRAMALCHGRLALPFRVSLAASFWFGVRLCGDKSVATWQNLRRLEEVSGVPRKVISAVEMKIEHALRKQEIGATEKHGRRLG